VHDGELGEGGSGGLVLGRKTCMAAVEELARVLQRVGVPAFLGHGKGRVRLVVNRGVHACRK
jgi:hypothetical protein